MATVLTAKIGTIQFEGHKETWYDLNMGRITERADAYYGIEGVYAVSEDGIKTYNGLVICAAHKSVPYGTIVNTSRGIGVVLDYHTVAEDKTLIDVATDWK
jgi:hypothetical protein